ncbi:ABC-type glycerol-3-phosphate transport system substrate-binding protein [Thermocatellispora tengchongensis]|uniref:ABC-type glycerol-3-phosphate transport system substrate-binding protein n=1 Tax=Thermocatellispora tengchongensis TaxID=1073253 RepID=A0A840PMD5_9ACTN|nr:extracellular solute-binding protein [Thermocatellispora tengchongensis]MBB5140232.1 ABC-type glycerol-3-phosphate transport system substrate-binding protein [Thermocatellispora tengchongensis]
MRVRLPGLFAATLVISAVAGCGSGSAEPAGDGKTRITVGDLPPTTQQNVREQFLKQVAAFEKANPDIDIEPHEATWDPKTFATRLAGGQLETVFRVPLTEPAGLARRRQVADITAEVGKLPHATEFDKRALAPATDANGRIHGLPTSEFALGLIYNRDLFDKAGLDPDKPPATWDEVRAAAKTIKGKTGVPGFAVPTTENTGGWIFTAMLYTYGGRLQQESGGKTVATLDTPQSRGVLDLLKGMRWQDDSMGSQHLRNAADLAKDFAAGKVAMIIGTPSSYTEYATQYGGAAEAFGMGALPSGDRAATLLGGQVAVVSPKATAAERAAGVKWIDFYYLRPKYDAAFAESVAAAKAADDVPVGFPYVSPYSSPVAGPVLTAERKHANVPVANFKPYEDGVAAQEFVTEPAVAAQDTYAALDSVIQATLTRKDADPAAELAKAGEKATAALNRAQR